MIAEWLTGIGTLGLAIVAVFQDSIRSLVYHPTLEASIETRAPHCNAVPLSVPIGEPVDCYYLRIWISNTGNATAKNAEVYAKALLTLRADRTWEPVGEFPPMNLKWSDINTVYWPNLVPKMGKHCDLGHIIDPAHRHHPALQRDVNPRLQLTDQQASLAFDLITAPNHKGHVIGPGEYRLQILIAAENARPIEQTISISLTGRWDTDEARMLRNEVGISITSSAKLPDEGRSGRAARQ
jgi:hypothetical protein